MMTIRQSLLAIVSIVCLGSIIYADSLFCSFHFDDSVYIVDNHSIRDLRDLFEIWKFYPCRFIPFLSLAINYYFHQLDVLWFHVVNLAVHLISAILVWWLVLLTFSTPTMMKEKIGGSLANSLALLAGLIFVSHPLQTEAVTYIWQRATCMAAMFYLLSLCLYVRSRLFECRGGYKTLPRVFYIISIIVAILAMFTKEMTATLPVMILLYEFYFLRDKKGINWKSSIPFFVILLFVSLTVLWLPHDIRNHEMEWVITGSHFISPWQYFFTQLRVIVTYLRLIFIPLQQNLDYDQLIFNNFLEWPVLASFSLIIIIFILAQKLFSKHRLLSFSIFWFLLTLLPESSFIPLKDVIFEHRLYLPMAGFSMFLVGGGYYLWAKNSIKATVIVLTMVIACNAVLTYQRNKVWENDFTLWNDAVQKSPHKARPYFNRSIAYNFKGDLPDAVLDYRKALLFDPGFAITYPKFTAVLEGQGDLNTAVSEYMKLISADSPHALAYLDWGNDYQKQIIYDKAIIYYSIAASIDPNLALAYYGRGICYLNERKLDQALKDLTRAAILNPNLVEIHYDLAILYYFKADYSRAWISTERAMSAGCKVDPKFLRDLKKASGG